METWKNHVPVPIAFNCCFLDIYMCLYVFWRNVWFVWARTYTVWMLMVLYLMLLYCQQSLPFLTVSLTTISACGIQYWFFLCKGLGYNILNYLSCPKSSLPQLYYSKYQLLSPTLICTYMHRKSRKEKKCTWKILPKLFFFCLVHEWLFYISLFFCVCLCLFGKMFSLYEI